MSEMLRDIGSMTIMRIPMIMCFLTGAILLLPYRMLGKTVPEESIQLSQLAAVGIVSVLLHFIIKVPNNGGTDQ